MNTFEQTKQRINNHEIKSEIDCLRTIVLNISEKCQLHCPMCPRGNGYPDQDLFMDFNTACKTLDRLLYIKFDGTLSISGMGEPTLNPSYKEILKLFCITSKKMKYKVQILSNGISLKEKDIDDIVNYGAKLIISIHDETNKDIIINLSKWCEKYSNDQVSIRDHKLNSKEFKISNRAGYVKDSNLNCDNPCYYPFYKMVIDYDGSYLICQDDWKRLSKNINCNVKNMELDEYFTMYTRQWKKVMSEYGRQANSDLFKNLCAKCNTEGITMGGKMFEYFNS